jgi:hypothetical protein
MLIQLLEFVLRNVLSGHITTKLLLEHVSSNVLQLRWLLTNSIRTTLVCIQTQLVVILDVLRLIGLIQPTILAHSFALILTLLIKLSTSVLKLVRLVLLLI